MGSFSTQFTKGFTLKVEWTESGADAATNTSDLTVTAYLVAASGYYINSTAKKNISLTINGTTYSDTCYVGLEKGQTKALFTKTVPDIAHNSDGSKTVSISCTLGIKATLNDTYYSSVSTSGSATLTTIARASIPSLITSPSSQYDIGFFGGTITIHTNRKSTAFTHTVRYQFGSLSGTCINAANQKAATGIGESVNWKIPEDFMNQIPSNDYGTGTIYLDTYNGSTKIGTVPVEFKAKVPSTVIPSCTITLEDITGVDDLYGGNPVKGLSKIEVTVTGKQAYSSPIKSCVIEANGAKYNAFTATTGVLLKEGASAVKATVTDSRGRPGTATVNMTVQNYAAPAVTAMTVQRCNEDGTLNKRGAYAKVVFSATISSLNSKNTALYYIKYKKTSAASYTPLPLTDLTNQYSPSNKAYIFAAATGASYDVVVEAVDRHSASNPGRKTAKVPTAVSILSWRGFKTSSGVDDGVGIGKVPEKANTLQIGFDTEFFGKVTGTIFDAILPVGSMVLRYDHIDPATLYPGTTWERLENTLLWATDAGVIGWISTKAATTTSTGLAITQVSVWRRTA